MVPFFIHPAASPCVNVNAAPISYLKMLFEGKDSDEMCRTIVDSRTVSKRKFLRSSEFQNFVKKQKLQVSFREDAVDRIAFS